jgi:BA14K-like protein
MSVLSMNLVSKSLAAAVLVATSSAYGGISAQAAPLPGAQSAPTQFSSEVELARGGYYRGGYGGYGGHRYYGHRRHYGRNIGIGIGAAIIGGVILSEAARAERRRVYSSDYERCAQTYRSFEPRTGMYTGYDGVRRLCPYLD